MERPQKRIKQEDSPDFPLLQSQDETPGLPTGFHKKRGPGAYTKQRIESCERIFCSQTLDTPLPLPTLEETTAQEGPEDSAECGLGFSISYSQHYIRGPSQQGQEEIDDGAGPSSWESSATKIFADPNSEGKQSSRYRMEENIDRDISVEREKSSVNRADSVTPELCPDPEIDKQPAMKLFPLFRPKSQWKTLHIIRHGESEFNAACNSKASFGDPQVFDPKLTAKGRRQAEKLRDQLVGMKISKDALWVVSPMTRAMETMMLACPLSSRIGCPSNPLKTVVRKELAEQCLSTGDIGLPVSHLRNNFPQFGASMSHIPERWWFKNMENDALQKRLLRFESKAQLRLRIGEFRKWVQAQPEKVIVAFGHHCTFKELTNGQKGLRNCEVHTMSI